MKRLILAGVIILALTGCRKTWLHSTKDSVDFAEDNAECKAMSMSINYDYRRNDRWGISRKITERGIYHDCMVGKGWYTK